MILKIKHQVEAWWLLRLMSSRSTDGKDKHYLKTKLKKPYRNSGANNRVETVTLKINSL